MFILMHKHDIITLSKCCIVLIPCNILFYIFQLRKFYKLSQELGGSWQQGHYSKDLCIHFKFSIVQPNTTSTNTLIKAHTFLSQINLNILVWKYQLMLENQNHSMLGPRNINSFFYSFYKYQGNSTIFENLTEPSVKAATAVQDTIAPLTRYNYLQCSERQSDFITLLK